MSTRSAIAYTYGDGWRGRYVHSDGYPTERGHDVWNYLQDGFQRYRDLIDAHPAGFSWMPGPSEDPHGKVNGLGHGACYASWGRPGETDDPSQDYISEQGQCSDSCDPLFIEWVYVADPSGALTVLAHEETSEGQGHTYDADYTYRHRVVWTGRWDGAEPDWESIQQAVYA